MQALPLGENYDTNCNSEYTYADYENAGFGHGLKQDWDKYPAAGVSPGTLYDILENTNIIRGNSQMLSC